MSSMLQRPAKGLMIIGLLVASLLLAGCVSVPTSGKVEEANQGTRVNDSQPEAVPKPPVADASPRVIVDGFLFAMSRYQSNYQIARQFLTDDAKDAWRPEDKITIYSNPKYDTTDDNVVLSVTRVGQVGPDGSYTATTGPQVQDFGMQKNKNGQWRISNPPDGLLISDSSFSATYASYNLYFFDSQFRTLVPDPIYLPTNGRTETALVQALLRGPTSWLKSAVSTEFPAHTSLVGNSVPISDDHLAQISLSPSVAGLNDDQRRRLAAQLAWTLGQTDSELRGFQIAVNGSRLQIPGQTGEGENAYVPISYGSDYAPIPDDVSDSLIGIHDDSVVTVGNDGATLSPLAGPLGHRGYQLDSLALSPDGRTVAAVTADRTKLLTQVAGNQQPRIVLPDQQRLLRPDFTRDDELWAISGKPGHQSIKMIKNNKTYTVTASWLKRIAVTDFQISPDGSRMALIGKSGKQDLLAVAPIVRGDRITLGTVRFISMMDTASTQVRRIEDLGWISSTRLLILGAANAGASYEPYGVEIDGSQFERVGTSNNWEANGLATRADSEGSFQAVVAGRKSKAWIYRSGDEWGLLSNDLRAPAYSG